jgi:hypothetical protein
MSIYCSPRQPPQGSKTRLYPKQKIDGRLKVILQAVDNDKMFGWILRFERVVPEGCEGRVARKRFES